MPTTVSKIPRSGLTKFHCIQIPMQKPLIIIGLVIIVIGLLWPWLGKIPLGRLPGDIVINRPNIRIYIPITTMIVISLVISLIMKLFRK